MFKFIANAINTESATSSRRVILLYYSILIGSLVYIAIIALAYLICIHGNMDKDTVLQIFKYMIYLTLITLAFILLLAGVITWQNVNDSINSIKGLPQTIKQVEQSIETAKETVSTTTTTNPPAE